MNARALFSSFYDFIDQVPSPKWLGIAATGAALVLLVGLIVLSDRYLRLRRRFSEQGEPGGASSHAGIAGWEDELAPISLEGERRVPVDRLLPRSPRPFLLAVAVVAVACWAAGLALATDSYAFLTSHEWQLQPLYLAAHFITLRLFATMYTRNYLAGVVHLDMPTAHARRGIQLVQGPVGTLVALAVAIPFSVYDYQALGIAAGGTKAGAAGQPTAQLLYAMWCVEWFLMALIWVQLVGFLFLTRRAIGDYRFRSPIEVVLLEKQYRHFLAMSAHGATIVLGFFLVNAVYGWYTGAELTDYIGVAITLVLLVVGFIPPWISADHQDGPHRQGGDGGPAAAAGGQRDAQPLWRRGRSGRPSRDQVGHRPAGPPRRGPGDAAHLLPGAPAPRPRQHGSLEHRHEDRRARDDGGLLRGAHFSDGLSPRAGAPALPAQYDRAPEAHATNGVTWRRPRPQPNRMAAS